MRLLRPEMATWLLAVPLAAACWFLHYRYKWRSRRREPGPPASPSLARRSRTVHDIVVLLLGVLTTGLLAGALTRPQIKFERKTPEVERPDLILIMDRSVSIRARDIKPSRFGRAVDEIKYFLQRKPEGIDRVGLVGFAASPVVLSYPTRDVDSLFYYLDWVRDDPQTLFGTNIGSALVSALALVRRDPREVPPVFVIISDGDDDGEELERAVAQVRREHIRIESIGIGSSESVPMPVPGRDGREELLRDDTGRLVLTTFNESTLQRLAGVTGGRYFRSSTGRELQSALDTVARAAPRPVGWTTTTEYRDVYPFLLAAAAVAGMGLVVRL
jgi:Ca-activated chloride channel family protein